MAEVEARLPTVRLRTCPNTHRGGFVMPCIRCGRVTVKLCTCSIEQAKDGFSAWSEAELEEAVKTLREVLEAKRNAQERRDIPN
jgi:hypothetical protein